MARGLFSQVKAPDSAVIRTGDKGVSVSGHGQQLQQRQQEVALLSEAL